MEPYLSNKEEEISWDEFEKNLPPIFIQSIADYNLNSETVHILSLIHI